MPDFWFYGILNFLKKGRGSSNFRKIQAIVLKLHINILHPSRNFGIEFGQNRLRRSNFFRFWIFWEFFLNCLAGRRFYRIQLYTVITLYTQLNTAHLYMATTRHRTTLNVQNSIQHNWTCHNSARHNSTRHNSTRPQLDTPQPYTATTRHSTTLHRPHGRTVEATIQ